MIDGLRFLAKDTILYGLSSAFARSLTLITFPLLAQALTVSDYGNYDLLTSFAILISTLVVFGMDSSIVRFFYEFDDFMLRKKIISQALGFQVVAAAFNVRDIFWLLGPKYIPNIKGDSGSQEILKIIVIQIPFQILLSNAQVILQYTFRRVPFIILTVGSAVATLSAYYIGIVYFDFQIEQIFLVNLIISILFSAVGIYFIRNWLIFSSDFGTLKFLLPYALPMGLVVAISSFQPYFERVAISEYLDKTLVGIYAAGYKVGNLVLLPIAAFQAAWAPFMLSNYKKENSGLLFNYILKLVILGLSVLVIILTTFSDLIVTGLAGEGYVEGSVIVFPIAMGFFFQAISLFTGMGTVLAKKTHVRLLSYVFSLLVSISVIMISVRPLGILGIGIAVLIGQFSKCVLESYFGQRNLKFPWEYKRLVWSMLLIFFGGYVISLNLVDNSNYLYRLLLALSLIIISAVPLFSRQEISTVVRFFNKLIKQV